MNNLQGFELDPEIMGVLPTEEANGTFENRPTQLVPCDCGCGQPSAIFTDEEGGDYSMQTYSLRAQAADVPIEVYMSALAENMLERALMEISLEAMMTDVLGSIAELVAEQTGAAGVLVGIGPDGLVISTLSVSDDEDPNSIWKCTTKV